MTTRPGRLTPAEYRALVSALAFLESYWQDEGQPWERREYRALERAVRKVRATMTTPATRRVPS